MIRLLAPLLLLVQIGFAIHAFKTGKEQRWIWIIMFFPLIGCLAYYFVEIYSGSRSQRRVREGIRDIAKALSPDAELKRRSEALRETDTAENKAKLADECLQKGMFDEAICLYQAAMTATFSNDPRLTLGLARAFFYNGQYTDAKTTLQRLTRNHPTFYKQEVELLLARNFAALGNSVDAEQLYQSLSTSFAGLEAKVRYAQFLKANSRIAEANEMLDRAIKLGTDRTREMIGQDEWLKLAKQERKAK